MKYVSVQKQEKDSNNWGFLIAAFLITICLFGNPVVVTYVSSVRQRK